MKAKKEKLKSMWKLLYIGIAICVSEMFFQRAGIKVLLILLGLGVMIASFVSIARIWRCPYCEKRLGQSTDINFCPHCGGKLED